MRTWIINVQSITDIITNSSSETFVIPYNSIIPKIYKLINSIFIASGINARAEDILKVELISSSYGNYHYDKLKITCLEESASEIVNTLRDVLDSFYAEEISDY